MGASLELANMGEERKQQQVSSIANGSEPFHLTPPAE
jgi:hypothetical protein